eukprot:7425887-Pyramimonas_sp.AAC.1
MGAGRLGARAMRQSRLEWRVRCSWDSAFFLPSGASRNDASKRAQTRGRSKPVEKLIMIAS